MTVPLSNVVGANLRAARIAAGLTQSGLAREAQTSEKLIGDCEAGRRIPRLENLVELAWVVDVSVDDLATPAGERRRRRRRTGGAGPTAPPAA